MNATILLIGLLLPASPPALSLPAEAKGEPADFVAVAAETTGKAVKWKALDPGLSVFPVDLLKDSRTAVVSAKAPGRYRLMAMTCAGDEMAEPAVCVVVIAQGDSLARTLQLAYGKEGDPGKGDQLKALASLYRQAGQEGFLSGVKTYGQLFKAMADAAGILGVAGKLKGVQDAVAEELGTKLPTKGAAEKELDAEGRKQAADAFLRISKALEAVR